MRVLAYAFKPGEPPRELQLWSIGDNPTDYGLHRWTARSVAEVTRAYLAKGNPLQIDIEHNTAPPEHHEGPPLPAELRPTGGYARLEIRGGAPWLVFDWSEVAMAQIRTRQRLFLSPDYIVDKKTGEIVGLNCISLVGNPGTHGARILAAAVRCGGKARMNLALFLAALRAALAAEDPAVAKEQITNLIAEIEKAPVESGGDETPTPSPAAATAAAGDPAVGGDTSAEDDEEKKRAAAAAVTAAAKPNDEVAKLKEAAAAKDRVLAAGDKIPSAFRVFASSLSKVQFDEFIGGLPQLGQPAKRIQASATPTRGKTDTRVNPHGELPDEDKKVMDRIFNSGKRPEESVTVLEDGRVRATHIINRNAGTSSNDGGAA
jgi:hypothetical protein